MYVTTFACHLRFKVVKYKSVLPTCMIPDPRDPVGGDSYPYTGTSLKYAHTSLKYAGAVLEPLKAGGTPPYPPVLYVQVAV